MKYSIVNYSAVLKNPIKRLEAEFHNSVSSLITDYYFGGDIIQFVQYGTSKELNETNSGFPTLRLNEFESLFIKRPEKYCDKIDKATFESLSLKRYDVLICRTNGNPKLVGKSAIVLEDYDYAFASYLFRIRTDHKKILPSSLVLYLNSSFGRNEIEKNLMISNQANFSPAKFREILIAKLGVDFQEQLDRMVSLSFDKHRKANSLYHQTEQVLLLELSLSKWKSKAQTSFTADFSKIKYFGRIDAEYFQPKYDEIIQTVKSYKGGWEPLGDLVKIKDQNFSPAKDKEYKYIELANIGANGEITGYTTSLGRDLPGRARRKVSSKDLIVSTIEGSLSGISLIESDLDGALCSTGFYVINSDSINSETLLVYLKSTAGQHLLKKGCSGTILTAINKDEFSKIVIPKFNVDIQTEIKDKITRVYNLRNGSKQLLEIAKRAIEIAIEQNEKKAQNWIDEQLN